MAILKSKPKYKTFDGYIDNPDGGAVITYRKMYKEMYINKFNTVLLRESGNINYTIYEKSGKDESFIFHFKIPSEVIPNFYYDVVVELYKVDGNNNLRSYGVRFFSNDPAFTFTHARAFRKNNLLFSDVTIKLNPETLKKESKVRNPEDRIFYVKSIYFAYLTMEKYNLFNRANVLSKAVKYNKNTLLENIQPADIVLQRRTELANKLSKEKEEEKKTKTNTRRPTDKDTKISTVSKVSKITKSRSNTKSIRNTKTTKKK